MQMLDKQNLLGPCVRLPLTVDADRLLNEIESIPEHLWGEYRAKEHEQVNAIFLKGYPPIQFKPDEDRPILKTLPYTRQTIYETLPGKPCKCLIAKLKPNSLINMHRDGGIGMTEYFGSTLRFHIPLQTNAEIKFFIAPSFFTLQKGEVWIINNLADHGVINDHPSCERIHLIVDMEPDKESFSQIEKAVRPEGWEDKRGLDRLIASSLSPPESPYACPE